jgi:tetratricopeptide (TPR) repeat protein
MLRGQQARDFKLPELGTGALKTFLDVARKDYTMLLYLHSGSPRCLKGLQVLSKLRDRNEDRVALVAIFQEPTPPSAIQGILDDAAIEPDVVLHDSRAAWKDTYRFPYLPVLLIAGRDGTIVYSRKGFEPEENRDLIAELEGLFRQGGGEEGRTSFQEARRIYGEALQYLDEGETEMALMFLRRVLDLAPGLSSVHCLIGDACRDLGRKREAARHYGRCLAADPRAYDLPEVREKLRSLVFP